MPQREYTDEEVMGAPSFEQARQATAGPLPGAARENPIPVRNPTEAQRLPRGTWVSLNGQTIRIGARIDQAERQASERFGRNQGRVNSVAHAVPGGGVVASALTGATRGVLGTADLAVGGTPVGAPLARQFLPHGAAGAFDESGYAYQPTNKLEQYVESIGEMVPNALTGRGVTRVLDPILAGAGAQAAGDLTDAIDRPEWTPWARMAGGAFGSGVSNLAPNGRQLSLLGRSLEGVGPQQMESAQTLMRAAQERGVPLTLTEAIDQVTGGSSGGRVQRLVESTQEGQRRFGPMMAERPRAIAGAVENSLDTITPPPAGPSAVGQDVQRASQGALDQMRGRINESASPLYERLPGQSLHPDDYANLASDPSYAGALERFRSNPELSAPFSSSPDNDLSVINEVIKQLDTDATAARQTIANPGGNNRLASLRGDARGYAADLASQASPDFALARQTVESGHRAWLDPLEAGPLGRVAKTDDIRSQLSGMFPDRAIEGAGQETGDAFRLMNERDPQAGKDLMRQYLATTFGEAGQDLQAGENAWGGAKWRAQIAGNPNQREALTAALEQTGGQDVNGLLEVLAATGKRQPFGSMTAFNTADMQAMNGANALTGVLKNGFAPQRGIGNALEEMNARRNARSLSEALMSNPDDAINVMKRAQSVQEDNPLLRAMLASYLAQ